LAIQTHVISQVKGKHMNLLRRGRDEPEPGFPFLPFQSISRLRDEINRLFENSWSDASRSSEFLHGWAPAIDVFEDQESVTVKAELPGLKREDIELSVQGSTLTISGERRRDEDPEDTEHFRSETYFGRFQRCIILPQPVDAAQVKATYRDGILCIELPKTEEARRRHIQVQVH
jgi:HSP20 family protein